MERVHAQLGLAEARGDEAARLQPHAVRRDPADLRLAVPDLRRPLAGQILQQRAAARDVEHLQAAADRQHGQLARLGGADERDLEAVEVRLGGAEAGVGLGAVDRRVQVRAARQAQAAEPVEQGLDAVDVQRRDDHGHRAGTADRLRIGEAERELLLGRLAVGVVVDARRRAHLRGTQADDRVRGARRGDGWRAVAKRGHLGLGWLYPAAGRPDRSCRPKRGRRNWPRCRYRAPRGRTETQSRGSTCRSRSAGRTPGPRRRRVARREPAALGR